MKASQITEIALNALPNAHPATGLIRPVTIGRVLVRFMTESMSRS